jgi:hypothetical protein
VHCGLVQASRKEELRAYLCAIYFPNGQSREAFSLQIHLHTTTRSTWCYVEQDLPSMEAELSII